MSDNSLAEKCVLYVLDYYLPHQWGVETVFEQIITRTLAQGWKVIVLTSHFDQTLPTFEQHNKLTIIRTGTSRKTFIRHAFWTGLKIFKQHKIHLIHSSTYGGAIPGSLLSYRTKTPNILTVHEIFDQLRIRFKPRYSSWIFRLFEWLIFKLPHSILHCISLYTLNALRLCYNLPDHKLRLIHNGLDTTFWNPQKITQEEKTEIRARFALEGKRNLLYFWHSGSSKGLEVLIEAIPQLLSEFDDLQLIINLIPAQQHQKTLSQISSQLEQLNTNQKQRFQLLEGLDKIKLRSLVASVDAVIAPSISEGFGSVHTETIALGTPLITTNVAAIPEVVGGKVILIPAGNPLAICNAVNQLKNDNYSPLPERHFDRKEQYARIFELYQQVL